MRYYSMKRPITTALIVTIINFKILQAFWWVIKRKCWYLTLCSQNSGINAFQVIAYHQLDYPFCDTESIMLTFSLCTKGKKRANTFLILLQVHIPINIDQLVCYNWNNLLDFQWYQCCKLKYFKKCIQIIIEI